MPRFQSKVWEDGNVNRYIARQGDTWDDIARQAYGDEHLMSILLFVNPDLADRVILDGGETIIIPIIAMASAEALPPWR